MKIFIAALFIFGIVGCSTVPMEASNASSSQNVVLYGNPTPKSGHIIVVRDNGIFGSACSPDLFLNGVLVANSLRPGQRVDLFPPPNTYILTASSVGLCSSGTAPAISIKVITNQTEILDFGARHGGVMFTPSTN